MSTDANYTIGQLAQAAGVTRRTIHYYVAQGLLPPPQSGGRAASYSAKHLQRLELIKLLKQEFLPLHEIKALLDGLDDEAVQSLLSEKRAAAPTPARETAKEYLRALLHPPDPNEHIHLHPAPEVSRGGCLVRTRFGIIDAQRETKVELIKKVMMA